MTATAAPPSLRHPAAAGGSLWGKQGDHLHRRGCDGPASLRAPSEEGQKNQAPTVVFLRKALHTRDLKIGTICHSLWLFCADPDLFKGWKVTCAHNIACDVTNAGGDVIFGDDGTADLLVDGNLITGKHPAVVDQFMEIFVKEIEAGAVERV